MKSRWIPRVLLVALAAILPSCGGGNDGFTNNDNCDYILAAGLSDGGTADISTDRYCPSYLSIDWDVQVTFRAPSEGAGELPVAGERSIFYVSHYDVTYRNDLTGGSVAGVDVPPPIRVPVGSLLDPGTDSVTLDGWPILEPGQKELAPLNNSTFYSVGGVPMTATLTWWGWPVTNPSATCFYTQQWYFTIYQGAPPPTDPDEYQAYSTACD